MLSCKSSLMRQVCLIVAAVSFFYIHSAASGSPGGNTGENTFYVFTPAQYTEAELYDCVAFTTTLQGIVNRQSPRLFLFDPLPSRSGKRVDGPSHWFRKFREPGEWLAPYEVRHIDRIENLLRIFEDRIRGVVVWDPLVPATLNVATTLSGLLDAPVASPDLLERLSLQFSLNTVVDLRGMFSGQGKIPGTQRPSTGSAKCDAYLWAKIHYLDTRRCNPAAFAYLLDGAGRSRLELGSLWSRDYIVAEKGFVFDLSPWGDEVPQDDLEQALGTDRKTFLSILKSAHQICGERQMIEVIGYPPFPVKYSTMASGKHHPVHTEWESVNLISSFGGFLNAGSSPNMSFHRHYDLKSELRQRILSPSQRLEDAVYVALHQSDYDGAAALYHRLPMIWEDPKRGSIPLAWGVNPNLVRNYPDIIEYLYKNRTERDFFVADASGAGYVNPNFLPNLEVWRRHCDKFYRKLDIALSPMVLDFDEPSFETKEAYRRFSPKGMACIVMDLHLQRGKPPSPHLFAGMPVIKMDNLSATKGKEASDVAKALLALVEKDEQSKPSFHYVRTVWNRPSLLEEVVRRVQEESPRRIIFLDPYTFFELLGRSLSPSSTSTR